MELVSALARARETHAVRRKKTPSPRAAGRSGENEETRAQGPKTVFARGFVAGDVGFAFRRFGFLRGGARKHPSPRAAGRRAKTKKSAPRARMGPNFVFARGFVTGDFVSEFQISDFSPPKSDLSHAPNHAPARKHGGARTVGRSRCHRPEPDLPERLGRCGAVRGGGVAGGLGGAPACVGRRRVWGAPGASPPRRRRRLARPPRPRKVVGRPYARRGQGARPPAAAVAPSPRAATGGAARTAASGGAAAARARGASSMRVDPLGQRTEGGGAARCGGSGVRRARRRFFCGSVRRAAEAVAGVRDAERGLGCQPRAAGRHGPRRGR